VATLFAPRLAQKFGYANTFALAMLPILLVLLLFALLAKDSPRKGAIPGWKDFSSVLREADTAWFCFFYCFTFGGFVGFASFLTVFFHDQYGLTKVRAGDFTTIVVLAGSFLRPVGGWFSDKIGGYRLLLILLCLLSAVLCAVGTLLPLAAEVTLLFFTLGMLGMGNGAVFQLVPQRFPERIGILTGLVGAAGGFGGFLLPSLLGAIKDRTGQYAWGLYLCAAAFFLAAATLLQVGTQWHLKWHRASIDRAGIFSYRRFFSTAAQESAE
jgi:NNP family nitrate/nitrite transporter-like MFS transporter